MDAKEYIEKCAKLCNTYYDKYWGCMDCPAYNTEEYGSCRIKHNNSELNADEKINLLLKCEQESLI